MVPTSIAPGPSAGIVYFDCSQIGGSPVGRPFRDQKKPASNSLPDRSEFPSPAQEEVIESVLAEKREALQADPKLKFVATVYRHRDGRLFLQDGQHRLVASCVEGRPIGFKIKSVGFPLKPNSWEETRYVNDRVPAKERLKQTK